MIGILLLLLICVVATIIIESVIPKFILFKNKTAFRASLICNIITNPILNTILLICGCYISEKTHMLILTILLEIIVVFVEAYIFKTMLEESFVKWFIISFVLNTISFLIGIYFADAFYFKPPINPHLLGPN